MYIYIYIVGLSVEGVKEIRGRYGDASDVRGSVRKW